jgi:hypothetical protein
MQVVGLFTYWLSGLYNRYPVPVLGESLRLDSCTVDVEILVVFQLQILDIWPYLLCFHEYDGDISSSRLSESNLRGVHHGW